jgi:6-phosphogluconolactonase
MEPRVIVVKDAEAVAAAACDLVMEAERQALARDGVFRIALSGGSTPRRLHKLLAARSDAHFARWQVFFGDERWVPPDHADSNFRMARETLLDHVAIPLANVHPIDTRAGSPKQAAFLYSWTLKRRLPVPAGGLPRFDLVLLGLGADGHTASLFPGSTALDAAPPQLAVATWAPSQGAWRVTLTAPLLNAARAVVFLVSGRDKADALEKAMSSDAMLVPAAMIRPVDGTLTFVVDEAAGVGMGGAIVPS